MSLLRRHALTIFGSGGVLGVLATGALLVSVLDSFNRLRILDMGFFAVVLLFLSASQAVLISGIVVYVASRRGYVPPPLPELPNVDKVVLIPAYMEEGRVGEVVRAARRYADVVIVVDDGSTDGTAEEASRAGAVVIRHHFNMGYGAAVKTLLYAALRAGARYAVLLDADGQHDPDEIPKFFNALREADLVVGNRFVYSNVPRLKRLGIGIIRLFHRALGIAVEDPENGFRGFSRRAIEVLWPRLEETWMGISSQAVYLAHRLGLKIVSVPVTVRYAGAVASENLFLHGLSVIWTIVWTWLSENPLRTLGVGISALGLAAALGAYTAWLFNATRHVCLPCASATVILEVVATVLIGLGLSSYVLRGKGLKVEHLAPK